MAELVLNASGSRNQVDDVFLNYDGSKMVTLNVTSGEHWFRLLDISTGSTIENFRITQYGINENTYSYRLGIEKKYIYFGDHNKVKKYNIQDNSWTTIYDYSNNQPNYTNKILIPKDIEQSGKIVCFNESGNDDNCDLDMLTYDVKEKTVINDYGQIDGDHDYNDYPDIRVNTSSEYGITSDFSKFFVKLRYHSHNYNYHIVMAYDLDNSNKVKMRKHDDDFDLAPTIVNLSKDDKMLFTGDADGHLYKWDITDFSNISIEKEYSLHNTEGVYDLKLYDREILQATDKTLTNSGDDLTFVTPENPLVEGSIAALGHNDITSDVSSYDYLNGSLTFTNSHTEVYADYIWEEVSTVTEEALTNSGDDLTFNFANTNLQEDTIAVFEKLTITSDISSKDHMAGTITFANSHTGTVTADYTYNTTSAVSGESLTDSGDSTTFNFANTDLQHGSIVVYEDGTDVTTDVSSFDYANGAVTFSASKSGTITADYEYVTGTNDVTGETLTTSDDLTFSFANTPLDEGSVVVYEKLDVTSDVDTFDYTNGNLTFASTHTGTVTADYDYITAENQVSKELLTNSGDDLTFAFENSPVKNDSVSTYERVDITSDIASVDLAYGEITFNNTHPNGVIADYMYKGKGERIISAGSSVKVYNTEANIVYEDIPVNTQANAVAVDADGDKLALVGKNGETKVYGLGVTAYVHRPTNVQHDGMTLNGELYSMGGYDSLDCYFEYSDVADFSQNVQSTTATTLTEAGKFSADITGLNPETKYYFRAVISVSA